MSYPPESYYNPEYPPVSPPTQYPYTPQYQQPIAPVYQQSPNTQIIYAQPAPVVIYSTTIPDKHKKKKNKKIGHKLIKSLNKGLTSLGNFIN